MTETTTKTTTTEYTEEYLTSVIQSMRKEFSLTDSEFTECHNLWTAVYKAELSRSRSISNNNSSSSSSSDDNNNNNDEQQSSALEGQVPRAIAVAALLVVLANGKKWDKEEEAVKQIRGTVMQSKLGDVVVCAREMARLGGAVEEWVPPEGLRGFD